MMLRNVFLTPRWACPIVVLFLAAICLTGPASAQVANAVVTGIVTDAQGGVLPGVTITVTNTESGVVRTIVTETEGRYRLGGVPPGRYNLTAELPGFTNVEVKDITLTIGLEYAKDITMGLQGFAGICNSHRSVTGGRNHEERSCSRGHPRAD
jgi:hypothetical protein